MSGNGCSCAGTSAPAREAAASENRCGSGAQHTEVAWDPLAFAASSTEYSRAFATRGANSFDFILLGINSAGTYQIIVQAQVSSDGINWTNAGSAVQLLAAGYTTSGAITGNGFRYARIIAQNQVAYRTIFSAVVRFFCT